MWGDSDMSSKGGGGFMDESYNPTQGAEKQKKDANHIVPMMIQQCYKDSPDTMLLGGKSVRMLSLVAIVRKIERVTTKIAYDLEDETGTITAFRWLEAEAPDVETDIEVNKYVRVFGSLREQAERGRHMFLLRILPVKKLAEVYSHLLEVTYAALREEAGGVDGVMSKLGESNGSNIAHAPSSDNADGSGQGFTKEQAIVFAIVSDPNNPDAGIERNDIKSRVPSHIASKVDEILIFLESEGHMYTTCTDNHFKAT